LSFIGFGNKDRMSEASMSAAIQNQNGCEPLAVILSVFVREHNCASLLPPNHNLPTE